ncbi:P-loop containing nucleoside triphosphate hydrolase protein [Mycena filopes]|nr:P-loop containing nucleoside triphosphate hydrolase protein [Mycena filopes]
MPRSTPRLENRSRETQILQHTTAAARLLLNVSDDNANNPYLKGIAGITLLVLETIQTVKSNKTQCLHMLEEIHVIISAIINLRGDSPGLSPAILRDLSEFSETLQKVHSFVRSQVDLSLFRRVLRHSETTALLTECNAGLNHAIEVFGIRTSLGTAADISNLQALEETRHQEVLELLREANSTRSTFSFYQGSSSSSLFLLPSSPHIFYGRDAELVELRRLLVSPEPYRVAILGPGGIGKSSLALAALHHPDVVSHFSSQRYFISLESSTSASDMLSAIAAFLGIEETPKLSRAIVRYLSDLTQPCVMVLDNLEDCWEAPGSRGDVEDFISLLSEIRHLQLMITMRGAERPGKVKWTRPFLPPLERLDDTAARQTFLDISDEVESDDLTALLALTDNLPLAIALMANLTSFEGTQSVLKRWEGETTSLLSEGFAKQANLDKSITISLSSPRMRSNPHAQALLSLLSLLPDGTSEDALAQMNLPLNNQIAHSKSTLLRCSLIYVGPHGRLRTLAPIRQYVREKFPPDADSFDGLRSYLYALASLFRVPTDLPNRELIQRLSYEFANVRSVATYALGMDSKLADTVRCIIDLMHFNASARSASFELSDSVGEVVERIGDPVLKGDYLLAQARVIVGRPSCFPLLTDALRCFEEKDDVFGQGAISLHLFPYTN